MIKEIKSSDIDSCVTVIKESFLTVANEFGFTQENAPRFTAFSTTAERLNWQFHHEHRPMFAYFVQTTPVGYYSLAAKEGNLCELNNLCVLPKFRHRKIGEQLLKHAFAFAEMQNCTKMLIGIVEENKLLKKWYQEFGFIPTGTQKYDFFPFTCGYMEKNLVTPCNSNQ